jgi:TPR repeat protein
MKWIFIEKNEEQAVLFFQKASKQDYSKGRFYFGKFLIEGKGIKKSFLSWIRISPKSI